MKRSLLTEKNSCIFPPEKVPFREARDSLPEKVPEYLKSIITEATSRPRYWAATVPVATPSKPIPLMPRAGIPTERAMLATMLTTLTTVSVTIELKVSCIPMNQPLTTIRDIVAGEHRILIVKYLTARFRTSSEQSTKQKKRWQNGRWRAIMAREIAKAVASPLSRVLTQSVQSSLPKAWEVSPPVPALRNPKFQ